MLGIAIQYGIELDALLAANPTVNPRLLSVGTELVIPLNGNDAEVMPTLTPVALSLSDPRCYPSTDGGAWCVIQVENTRDFSLENLSAWIGLFDDSGDQFASETAYSPLNHLPPGGRLPLMAFFPPPLPDSFTVRSELLTSFTIREDIPRYLKAAIQLESIETSEDGIEAIVNGQVVFTSSAGPPPRQVGVVITALGADDRIVGMRKAEYSLSCGTPQESVTPQTPSITSTVSSCPPLSFELSVYSLGPQIHQVEGLVEATP